MDLKGVYGVEIVGCNVPVGITTAVRLYAVRCLKAHSNIIASTNGFLVDPTSSGGSSSAFEFGPDSYSGPAGNYFVDTGGRASGVTINTAGGLSAGGGNALPTGYSLIVGTSGKSANNSLVTGFLNTSMPQGIASGSAGIARTTGETVIGGGTVLGTGYSQASRNVLAGKSPPGLVGGAGKRIYSITATFALANTSNYSASVRAVLSVLASSISGVMTILSQSATYADPTSTGMTVSAIAAGNDLNFQITNPLNAWVNATCMLDWAEAAGS